ncbi:MAG TPA: lasso peptide biosynthesis B2 protein [Acidobacteriaceae bacterium]|nr:lasso peptide biosynthesis B2 protein [Acidobacteriaceae bacterium]
MAHTAQSHTGQSRPAQSAFAFSRLPSELRLLLCCVRWPSPEADAREIRALAASGEIDWTRFLTLCGHHRVTPLVYRALSSAAVSAAVSAATIVPSATIALLKADATENALRAFRYLAETRRLCDLLQHAGVSVRVLKGVPLSQRIYDDPGVRDVGDIDLLIAPGMEETADCVLLADGFRRNDPEARLTPRRRRSWRKHGKDYTYRSDRDDFEIDLHWRLFRNPHMSGNALADTDANELVRFGQTELAVLPLDRSFLYLCVHGALDGWFRFKSLADVAALWRGFSAEQRSALADQAYESGILPEMAAALKLAQELQLVDADALSAPMQLQTGSREARWILDYAWSQHGTQRFEPTQDGAGSWPLKRYELGLRHGFAYRMEIVRRVLLRPRVWQRFDLPDALFPLYTLLSPMEWIFFHRRVSPAGVARMRRSPWHRWRALSASKKWLLLEAFAALAIARWALVLLPVRWIFHWLESPVGGARSSDPDVVERVRWAVLTVARYGPVSFVCFPQALAAHAMLRRRGIGSIMHYGVRRSADRKLRAHTWLEVDHRMLLGGESALLFAPIHSTNTSSE